MVLVFIEFDLCGVAWSQICFWYGAFDSFLELSSILTVCSSVQVGLCGVGNLGASVPCIIFLAVVLCSDFATLGELITYGYLGGPGAST